MENDDMIEDSVYQNYFTALLAGSRSACHDIVQKLLDADTEIREIYEKLFQQSMYKVGELWENNLITVAGEHLATSITEGVLNLVYPHLFAIKRVGKKAVVSCSANEFHQIGGKMVADIFELNGWDGYFLGANTPSEELMRYIHEVNPDILALSLSLLSNIDNLIRCIEIVKSDFPNLNLLVGGQAFRWGGIDMIKCFSGVKYVSSLDRLEKFIKEV
jgi:methanogenic corrinoid protein MtbC1